MFLYQQGLCNCLLNASMLITRILSTQFSYSSSSLTLNKKKKRWLMCCAAATCLTAQYTWLQPYEFSRLGSSSYCDPYSLGQNTVCSQWCHWEMSRVLVGDSLSTLMQVDSYGLLVTISFRFSPASSPPGYPVRHNN